MSASVRHGLPLLEAGQAQKEVTHNEAISLIDMRLQLAVQSRTRTDPPATPQPGEAYIVPEGAIGAWAAASGKVAVHDGFGWRFDSPVPGAVAWVADEGGCVLWDGGWSSGWPVASLRIGARSLFAVPPVALSAPAGGATIDVEARAAIGAILTALQDQGLIS